MDEGQENGYDRSLIAPSSNFCLVQHHVECSTNSTNASAPLFQIGFDLVPAFLFKILLNSPLLNF